MLLPVTPYYSHVVFAEDVVVVDDAPAAHASDDADSSSHSSSSDDTTTFSSKDDTDGVSNYHAAYPYWVYASHPSTQCEQQNKNCPATSPTQLAKYNHHREVTDILILVFVVVILLVLGALIYTL